MTIVAYSQGGLYADRLFLVDDNRIGRRIHLDKKLFINPEKTVAFGVVGLNFHPKDHDALLARVTAAVTVAEIGKFTHEGAEEVLGDMLEKNNTSFLAITAHSLYLIYRNKDGLICCDRKLETISHALGSGSKAFLFCIDNGLTPSEAMHQTSLVDLYVSQEFDCIMQEDLKPLEFLQ